jgi:hypothetical protein
LTGRQHAAVLVAFDRHIEVHITDDGINLMELKLKPDLAKTDSGVRASRKTLGKKRKKNA